MVQGANRKDLERALQFVLPKFGQSLGSDSLTSLLCLEMISTELNLIIDFEDLWKTETDSSKIVALLLNCIEAEDDLEMQRENLSQVEGCVASAIQQVDREERAIGKVRLQKIVERMLESDCKLDGILRHQESILHLFESGPGEKLLSRCQRKNDPQAQTRHYGAAEEVVVDNMRKVWIVTICKIGFC